MLVSEVSVQVRCSCERQPDGFALVRNTLVITNQTGSKFLVRKMQGKGVIVGGRIVVNVVLDPPADTRVLSVTLVVRRRYVRFKLLCRVVVCCLV